ncbi:asparagine synthase (glutamine-hydrolyzing) [bacterium]|nr:asparagine synthase (glutamine-hydrolyzing) [bacterium]
MCGICGFWGESPEDNLHPMADAILHRGPDEAGYYWDPQVGLAIRRLSVIDIGGGGQPLRNEDGSLVLVYNGEIYNYRELRADLQSRGHVFRTQSDGEVILHLYEELGVECLGPLNGMFALALWDRVTRRLLLARDRLGIKPLYYQQRPGQLLFGSELKAILRHPDAQRELDQVALDQYFTFDYVPAPRSIFRGIQKLLPAHYLLCQPGQIQQFRYWQSRYQPEVPPRSLNEWTEEFDTRLRKSIHSQMVSDVPLGAFLSGGLDSSTIVAYMAEASSRKLSTFSIGFHEPAFDESAYARTVAETYGTDHHQHTLGADEIMEVVPEVTALLDEPLADPSVLPTFILSRFARRHVTVVLSGDGGDELLAGYPTYSAAPYADLARHIPKFLTQRLLRYLDWWPASFGNWSLDFKVKRFLSRLYYPPEERNVLWIGSCSPEDKLKMYGPAMLQHSNTTFEPFSIGSRIDRHLDALNRLLFLDLNFYLADDLLVKLDRASMSVSLEGRVPFLDHELVEFLSAAPTRYKLNGWKSKVLLKELGKRKLPASILNRPKKGFGIPVARWLQGPLRSWLCDLLQRSELERDGLFNHIGVHQMLNEHFSGRRDWRKQLWSLACFISWRRGWFHGKQ